MATFSNIWGGVKKVADLASHLHTLSSIFGVFGGHDAKEDAPAVAKGLSGILGFRDEREWLNLLSHADRRVPGSAEVVSQFVSWHFRFGEPEPNLAVRLMRVMRSNQFRAVIIDMAKSDGRDTGTAKHTFDHTMPDGTKVHTETTQNMRDDGSHAGVDLVLKMHQVITSTGRQKIAGYRKCLNYIRAAGVPILDPEREEWVRNNSTRFINAVQAVMPNVIERVRAGYQQADQAIVEHAQNVHDQRLRQEAGRSFGQRLIESIFGR